MNNGRKRQKEEDDGGGGQQGAQERHGGRSVLVCLPRCVGALLILWACKKIKQDEWRREIKRGYDGPTGNKRRRRSVGICLEFSSNSFHLTGVAKMTTPDPTIDAPSSTPPAHGVIEINAGVSKVIVRPGTGDTPPLHSRCLGKTIPLYIRHPFLVILHFFLPSVRSSVACTSPALSVLHSFSILHSTLMPSTVHYIGRLADSGDIFINTREESTASEPVIVVAGRGQ